MHKYTHQHTLKPTCALITLRVPVWIGACTQLQISCSPNTNIWQWDELSQDAPEHEINKEKVEVPAKAKAALLRGEVHREKEVDGCHPKLLLQGQERGRVEQS